MPRSKQEIIARMNEVGIVPRKCSGTCSVVRNSEGSAQIDIEARKIPFVIVSNNNAGERFDWWEGEVYIEELKVDGARFEGLQTFFTDHRLSVDNATGRIENKRIEDGKIKCDVIFGTDRRANDLFQKFVDGILTDVSVGYVVKDIVVTSKKDEPDHVLVTDYEIVELSAVWRGFDAGAKAGRSAVKPTPVITRTFKTDPETQLRALKLKEKIC